MQSLLHLLLSALLPSLLLFAVGIQRHVFELVPRLERTHPTVRQLVVKFTVESAMIPVPTSRTKLLARQEVALLIVSGTPSQIFANSDARLTRAPIALSLIQLATALFLDLLLVSSTARKCPVTNFLVRLINLSVFGFLPTKSAQQNVPNSPREILAPSTIIANGFKVLLLVCIFQDVDSPVAFKKLLLLAAPSSSPVLPFFLACG